MTGYLKWRCEHVGYLRLGPRCRAYGDPWEWGVQIVRVDPRSVLIEGLHGFVSTAHWRGVKAALRAADIERMGFERLNELTGEMDLQWHPTGLGREGHGPPRATTMFGPLKESIMPDYELTLTFESKSKASGKSSKTTQTIEGDAALRRSVQRDLLKLQSDWVDADEAQDKSTTATK